MIACTQPRRVAAMTVAQRVAEELGCRLGQASPGIIPASVLLHTLPFKSPGREAQRGVERSLLGDAQRGVERSKPLSTQEFAAAGQRGCRPGRGGTRARAPAPASCLN